jgi:hypothetical protein
MSPHSSIIGRRLVSSARATRGLTALCLILLCTALATAADRFVSPDGLDSGGCSSAVAPCAHLQYAAAQALSGDTLRVAHGSYPENLVVPNTLTALTIEGGWSRDFSSRRHHPELTLVDAGGSGVGIEVEPCHPDMDLVLSGLKVSNAETGVDIGSEYCPTPEGDLTVSIGSCLIVGNEVGINTSTSDEFITNSVDLVNTVIVGNIRGGLIAYADMNGYVELSILNCTITGNSGDPGGGLSLHAWGSSSGWGHLTASLLNSIVWGNQSSSQGDDIQIDASHGPQLGYVTLDASYSDVGVLDNVYGTYNPLAGMIQADPRFEAGPVGFTLAGDSPCVDTADDAGAPDVDVEGDPRPLDGDGVAGPRTDMGADEYVPGLIFRNGFESADPSAWDQVVP